MNTTPINPAVSNFITPTLSQTFTTATKGLLKTITKVPNPVRVVNAYAELSKFRKLNASELDDMGLTNQDVANATLSDFLYGPTG